jgi:DNA mismatch endonuclease (patch repair protein)
VDFWLRKAAANQKRDARKEGELEALGWRVFVVWQCELADPTKRDSYFDRLARKIAEFRRHDFPMASRAKKV